MKPRKLFFNTYVKHILLAILIVIVLSWLILLWLDHYTHHGSQVAVPDVTGMQVDQAAPFFEKRTLQYTVVDSIYVKNKPAGSILETVPPVGTNVKEGRTIYLTINSRDAQLLTIPPVIDMSQRQAMAMLRSLGFEIIHTRTVPGAYKDLVVELETSNGQKIDVGSRIPASTSLVILISSGIEEESLLPDSMVVIPEDSEEYWY